VLFGTGTGLAGGIIMIIALAGRRIDAQDTTPPRFPLANVEDVRCRLRDLFQKNSASALVSSAACGADLIAQQEAGRLGMRRRIVLPFDSERFRDSSVIDRPGEWLFIYESVLAEVAAHGDIVTLRNESDEATAYAETNHAIFKEATDLSNGQEELVAVLVWDKQSRGSDDLTQGFADEATKRGISIFEVSTLNK
jgi:hypothetical protein